MADLFDYLRWRGDLTFTQDPPNAVDALIFSNLSYLHYAGRLASEPRQPLLLREAAAEFLTLEDQKQRTREQKDIDLLKAASESTRFGFIRMVRYRDVFLPEQDTQFAAVTFLLDDGSAFIAFRGTDNSLVGWKEDFNMCFQQTIPGQLLALDYVREIHAEYAMPLRIGGHSKGGNLAVFSAARSSPVIQQWIIGVYNHDGPGFTDYLIGDPGYKAMVSRIRTFVPQSSVIGMLLEHEEPYTIIRSNQVSLLQHDPYSWEVMGREFVPMKEITSDSRFVNETIRNWLSAMNHEERTRMVESVFGLLASGNVESTSDLLLPKNLHNLMKTIGSDEAVRRVLSAEFLGLVEAARKTKRMLEAPAIENELPDD